MHGLIYQLLTGNSVLLNKIQGDICKLQEDLRVLGKMNELLCLLSTNKEVSML